MITKEINMQMLDGFVFARHACSILSIDAHCGLLLHRLFICIVDVRTYRLLSLTTLTKEIALVGMGLSKHREQTIDTLIHTVSATPQVRLPGGWPIFVGLP